VGQTTVADAPLILTLALDERAQGWFDGLRRAHFPPERNFLDAHLTLFHHLPPAHEGEIAADIAMACSARGPLPLTATGPILLGRGVAFALDSPGLLALRAELATRWWPWLGAQDRGRFRPHVTVQNKVEPARARALHAELAAGFAPFAITGEGLLLWRYRGGPWEPAGRYAFGR
jgi:hypothetical protein